MQPSIVDPDPANLTRSELWFDDGSLVLQAECTQFRIHRSIMCASSTVFKEMFDLPKLISGDEVVEGCPVVHLSDSAVDVQHVLKANYDRGYGCDMDPVSFPMVSAFLRLGKKYEITRLYDEAMKYLQDGCPITLEAFQCTWPGDDPAIYIRIANLALETGTHILLPAALSMLLMKSTLCEIASGLSMASNTHFLRHDGLTMICLGYHRLRRTALHNHGCSCVRRIQREVESITDTISTLMPWDQCFTNPRLCANCVQFVPTSWSSRRICAWQELPTYYGLPPWDELALL